MAKRQQEISDVDLENRSLKSCLEVAEKSLIDYRVIRAKEVDSNERIIKEMEKIATSRGENSKEYLRKQKLLDKILHLEWEVNRDTGNDPPSGSK